MTLRILVFSAVCILQAAHGQNSSDHISDLLDAASVDWYANYDKTEGLLMQAEKLLGPSPTPENAPLFIRTYQIRNDAATWFSHFQIAFEYISKNRVLIQKFEKDLGQEYAVFKVKNSQQLANLYNSIDDYPRALAAYSECVDFLKGQPESFFVCETLENITGFIAGIHYDKGEYEAAINQHLARLPYQACLSRQSNIRSSTYMIFRNIGQCYFGKKDYARAKKYFDQAEDSLNAELKTLPKRSDGASFTLYESLAAYYRVMGQYDSSLLAYQKAAQVLSPDNQNVFRIYKGLGEGYESIGNFRRAEEYYRKAEQFLIKTQGPRNVPLGNVYFTIGQFHMRQHRPETALQFFQKSMACVVADFEPNGILNNPALKNITSKRVLFSALQQKTETLWRLYEQKDDNALLRSAWDTNQLARALLDSTANEFSLHSDKVILAEQSFAAFEKGIQIASALHKATNDQYYADASFSLADRSKGLLLLENLRLVNRYAGAEQDLLEKEKIIRSELLENEQELYKLESTGESSNELILLRDRYSTVKREYSQWLEKIKREAPGYYSLRFDHHVISPQQIQRDLLKPGEALLEYFVGDSTLTIFGFTQSDKYLHQQVLPTDFPEMVNVLREYLASGDDEKSIESFRNASTWLYDLLVRNCVTQLGTGITSLTIVPDGLLGYVPFEILLDSRKSKEHYLISDYSMHYAYSASYLSEQFQKKSSGSTSFFAGFVAAGSEDSKSNEALGFLKGAQVEVASIVEMLGRGTSVFNPATKKDFIQRAGDYKVLHLAMHSLVNDQNPMLSELVFADDLSDSVRDNRLTAIELYNMELNADMAVLSACNTGTGKAHRGEGIMSMSRAFAFAGVPSAVISLWQVPDKATSRIMVNYYHFLKDGNTKDKALQRAKETFVRDYPQMSDPFYWSGFIVTGSNDPLEFPSPLWWFWLGAIVILTSAFVMMARKGIHKKILAGFYMPNKSG